MTRQQENPKHSWIVILFPCWQVHANDNQTTRMVLSLCKMTNLCVWSRSGRNKHRVKTVYVVSCIDFQWLLSPFVLWRTDQYMRKLSPAFRSCLRKSGTRSVLVWEPLRTLFCVKSVGLLKLKIRVSGGFRWMTVTFHGPWPSSMPPWGCSPWGETPHNATEPSRDTAQPKRHRRFSAACLCSLPYLLAVGKSLLRVRPLLFYWLCCTLCLFSAFCGASSELTVAFMYKLHFLCYCTSV